MISPLAIVETDQIGEDVSIHEYAVIRRKVVIGNNVVIHPHVVIEEGVEIGDGVEIFPGSYIGKRPCGAGATSRLSSYQSYVVIGHDCAIGPNAVIFYDVEIGHNTLVADGASLREQVRVGHHCLISRYVTINYNTVIGNRTKIMDLTHITGNCRIGDDVFISIHVSTVNDNNPIGGVYSEESIVGPTIADKSTVGASAALLPAICVGEGAIIGVGAVVTKDVAPYDVVMGVPAKVVKTLRQPPSEIIE
jgi:acetyltransferase-like isoleucine patch superfamily enzyme